MEYIIGIVLAAATAALALATRLDRDRAFYPTVLMVVATYYVLFAAIDAPRAVLITESVVAIGFLLFAVVGFRTTLWLVAAGLAGHGAFDFVHHRFIDNPGMPQWWPGFCGAYDVALAVIVGAVLAARTRGVSAGGY